MDGLQLIEAKMAYVFRGQFLAKMDAKSRLAIAASLRSSLSDGANLVVTKSIYMQKKCLDVYTWEAWQKLEERIAALPSLNVNIQAFQRFYLSAGQPVQLDKQNRILLPKHLKEYAALDTEVVLVGMGEKFEIWPQLTWDTLSEDLAQQFATIQAGVASLEGED